MSSLISAIGVPPPSSNCAQIARKLPLRLTFAAALGCFRCDPARRLTAAGLHLTLHAGSAICNDSLSGGPPRLGHISQPPGHLTQSRRLSRPCNTSILNHLDGERRALNSSFGMALPERCIGTRVAFRYDRRGRKVLGFAEFDAGIYRLKGRSS